MTEIVFALLPFPVQNLFEQLYISWVHLAPGFLAVVTNLCKFSSGLSLASYSFLLFSILVRVSFISHRIFLSFSPSMFSGRKITPLSQCFLSSFVIAYFSRRRLLKLLNFRLIVETLSYLGVYNQICYGINNQVLISTYRFLI